MTIIDIEWGDLLLKMQNLKEDFVYILTENES